MAPRSSCGLGHIHTGWRIGDFYAGLVDDFAGRAALAKKPAP